MGQGREPLFESAKLFIEYVQSTSLFFDWLLTLLIFVPLFYCGWKSRPAGLILASSVILGFHRKLLPFLPACFSPKIILLLSVWTPLAVSRISESPQIWWKRAKNFFLSWSTVDVFPLLFFASFCVSALFLFLATKSQASLHSLEYPLFGLLVFATFRFLPESLRTYHQLLATSVVVVSGLLFYSLFISRIGALRMNGILGKNSSAFVLCIVIPYLLSFFLHQRQETVGIKKQTYSLLIVAYLLVSGVVVLGLGSRSGLILYGVMVCCFFMSHRFVMQAVFAALVLGMLASPLYSKSQNFNYVMEKYTRTLVALVNFKTPPDKSSQDRLQIWKKMDDMPITVFGYGLGHIRQRLDPLATENLYIETVFDLGWFGLATLLSNIAASLLLIVRNLKKAFVTRDRELFSFWYPSLVAALNIYLYGMFNDLLYPPYLWLFWGILYGYDFAWSTTRRQQNSLAMESAPVSLPHLQGSH